MLKKNPDVLLQIVDYGKVEQIPIGNNVSLGDLLNLQRNVTCYPFLSIVRMG